jgi:hypothetical protein
MGNQASTAMAASGMDPGKAMKNVNQQLGLAQDEEANDKKKAIEYEATKKERDLKQQERVTEYRTKQVKREIRKASLQEKWNRSHQQNS